MSSAISNWVSNPAENHGPLISVVLWCLWLFCGIFLGLRMYVRLQHRRFWWDDALLILAWVFLLAQVILMQLSIDLGFGKHILDSKTSPQKPPPLYSVTDWTRSGLQKLGCHHLSRSFRPYHVDRGHQRQQDFLCRHSHSLDLRHLQSFQLVCHHDSYTFRHSRCCSTLGAVQATLQDICRLFTRRVYRQVNLFELWYFPGW